MTGTFLTKEDVSAILGVSGSNAYKIIADLNRELESKGYLTVKGKVVAAYFEERYMYKQKA